MRIGDRYSDKKLYRGIKYSNKLPLLAEDLHEFSDTLVAKNNHLLENIVGSGILNKVDLTISDTSVSLAQPLVLNISGDICLVSNSEGVPFVTVDKLATRSTTERGSVFIVGWYQNIIHSTTMREYGGVSNTTLENNLVYEPLQIQPSSRYQFRWDVAVYEGEVGDTFTLTLPRRDKDGEITEGTYEITPNDKIGTVYRAESPTFMDYAVDGLYILPVFRYDLDSTNHVLDVIGYPPSTAGSSIIKSESEPEGIFTPGTIWYNPVTREFKTYIEGTGFVASASKMGFIQYQYVNVAEEDTPTETDLQYDLDVPTLQETDIIRVVYEGLDLVSEEDYTIDIRSKTITLKDFTRLTGEKFVVTVTRLVEASDVTSLTGIVTRHIETVGSPFVEGHLKLTDEVREDLDVDAGVAATPKSVYEAKFIVDKTTNARYQFVVEEGIIYLEEV